MSDGIKFEVHEMPLLDTGIGRSMGYEDDRAFMEAEAAKLNALPPEVRDAVREVEAEMDRRFLFGDGLSSE